MIPKYRMSFGRGVLLGYNDGEFGSGIVFTEKGKVAEYFRTGCVTQMIRWEDRVAVFTEDAMLGDGMLYVASIGADETPTIEPFFRLVHGGSRGKVTRSGALVIDGGLRLFADGRVEYLRGGTIQRRHVLIFDKRVGIAVAI